MTLQTTPAQLTSSVLDAVADGAWSAGDVAATVTAQVRAGRSDVVATLWDLVDQGALVYDASAAEPGFRPVRTVQA
ncbi:hypothetical protein [Nocardioides mesophilus]|uniref:BlaI/MecI/CopY family transcriptional regulator n=1 Tax=Nocardioides mesophilus TaxID=433659 RepID=A0A7G9RFH4_9ACTN|nr:hypothetical protein [Nocardioides mesophilus]QNN54349.1 hypothetical protein H9L09_08475 [Nocardioides mesophilus]